MYGQFWTYADYGCVMLIDTEREREGEVASQYPFPAMKQAECTISEQMALALEVEEGDMMYASLDVYHVLIALIDMYNEEVAVPNGLS